MTGMFAAWPRRVGLALVAVVGCLALFLFASAVVKAEQVVASWYGPGFEGATTASGEPFDPYDYTAAHKTYEFGTRLIVTYEGRSVVVRVNDRGPFVAGRGLDLSQGAAEYLGLTAVGVATVNVETATPDTPSGPYGGTKEVRRPAPTAQPEEPVRNAPQTPAADEPTVTDQQEKARQDFVGIGEDQYASADQYTEEVVGAEGVVVEEAIPPAPPAPKPAVPVLPPEPEPAALESPPVELVVPNSTIERRVVLEVAATPTPEPEPQPVPEPEPTPAPQPVPEPATKLAADPEPALAASGPVLKEKTKPGVEEKPESKKSEAPGGLTVLPDTGGAPVGILICGLLLLGAGLAVRVPRR